MNKLIYLPVFVFLFANCSHKITRSYQQQPLEAAGCQVVVKKSLDVPEEVVTKVGSISLGETGFSMNCSENDALAILRREACSLNANLVVITFERRPDLMSSCYRCRANFYQANSDEVLEELTSDEPYKPVNLQSRVKSDRARNAGAIIGAIVGGIVAGLVVTLL